jgi:hypothetical protein
MRKSMLVLLCATAPLAAQNWELGLFAGQQSYKSTDVPSMSYKGLTLPAGSLQPDSKVVYGARLGYSVVDMGPVLLQITGGFQPKSEATLKWGGVEVPDAKYTHEHTSIGAMFNFKARVAAGAGIEYRFEKVGWSDASESETFNYARPWFRANVGFSFPTLIVKPFLGLEVAMPLISKSIDVASTNTPDEDVYKALAPKLQIGIYAGIRFRIFGGAFFL